MLFSDNIYIVRYIGVFFFSTDHIVIKIVMNSDVHDDSNSDSL